MSYGPTTVNKTSYEDNIYENIKTLTTYINRNVIGIPIPLQTTESITRVPQSNEITNAGSLLKTLIYQLNGQDVDFKALIPFELEITLDGIGGLVVGQIFTIDKSILPKDYYNKNLGFIITGIAHTLQNNDWVTTIKTQICLLDNEKITENYFTDKNRLKARIIARRAEEARNSYLVSALADYAILQYLRVLSSQGTDINVKLLEAFANNYTDVKKEDNYMKMIISNIDNRKTSIDRYLQCWYDTADTFGSRNFPTSFTDFIATIADTQDFGNLLYDYNINSRTKAFADQLNGGNPLSQGNRDILFDGTIFSKAEALALTNLPIPREKFNSVTNDGSGYITINNPSAGFTTETEGIDTTNPGILAKDYYKIEYPGVFAGTTIITDYDKFPKQAFDQLHQIFYNTIAKNLTFTNGKSYLPYGSVASFTVFNFETSTGVTK
jgi:hypothetical protein